MRKDVPETDANEPDDYDGYVAYVTGRAPGLDGDTYISGDRDGEDDG